MIIQSMLDEDLYKFSIQNFILHYYPNVDVEYKFNNRDKSMKFTREAFNAINSEVNSLGKLKLLPEEKEWLQKTCKFLNPKYLDYLENYQYNPEQVGMVYMPDGDIDIRIRGKWVETVLWEVKLMAIISEVYFMYCDNDWNYDNQINNAREKALQLRDAGCKFSDFGTRRRRSFISQKIVVQEIYRCGGVSQGFRGTSNLYLAKMYGVNPIGTMAHEVVQGISALESMNHPNKFAMKMWHDFYGQDLKIFLPDTYGIDTFLKDFSPYFVDAYDGVRHDSGSPFEFTDKMIAHYKNNIVNPLHKLIVFSDGLDVKKAIEIQKYCAGKIDCSFGIGTNFSNDFNKKDGSKSKALNMVIKLISCDGNNVCKLSQNPGKAIGDPDMIRMMRHIHFGATL